MPTYFQNMDAACKCRGTTLTAVLREIGRSKSNVSSWKNGSMPAIDVCADMAAHLGISINEFVTGVPFDESTRTQPQTRETPLTRDEQEWMNLYHQVPENQRYAIKTFILQMIPESAPPLSEEPRLSAS